MANPVTLDLSSAKTLLAFGERAAKHGLDVPCDLQQFIDEPEKMARLVNYAKAGAPEIVEVMPDINWAKAYEKLGMSAEYADLTKSNPAHDNPSLWTVPVVKGVTCNKVVAVLRKLGVNVYLYANDLDKEVPTNDREANNGSYAVSFRKNVEADEEFKNLSANQLKKQNHKGITLLERLLLELKYFLETGKHLDNQIWTMCSSSIEIDCPGVLCVRWCDNQGLRVNRIGSFGPDVSFCAREVVADV